MARHLFIADPLASLDPARDTTLAMAEAARARGHDVFWAGPLDLGVGPDGAECVVQEVSLAERPLEETNAVTEPWDSVGEPQLRTLSDFAVVSMRVDPPVDRSYLHATFVLDHIDPTRTVVVNRPEGLRVANEKLFGLHVRELMPPTVVTARREALVAMAARSGIAVVKPLDGSGGRGVHLLRPDDPNLVSLIDTATEGGRVLVVAQGFMADVADRGDRRVLVLDGEPVGAYARIAHSGDFRCNGAGATDRADAVDDAVHQICDVLRPRLRRLGLHFVGLDVIGNRLTEINVTAPTGVRQIRRFGGLNVADRYVEFCETLSRANARGPLPAS